MTTREIPITLTIDPYFAGIYVMQRDFQARLNLDVFPADLDPDEKMAYIRTQFLALADEQHEALAETGWKPWATSTHINRDAYLGELADTFIFLMNQMIVADITPGELLTAVKSKIAKNIKRQDDGYDGVTTKCPGCKRAYDDDAVMCAQSPDGAEAHGWCVVLGGWVNSEGKLY